MTNYARGASRERDVAKLMTGQGWVIYRAAGSHGEADLVALKRGERPHLIQVKATARSPFNGFGPKARAALRAEADQAGAVAILAWWPPDRLGLRLVDEATWP